MQQPRIKGLSLHFLSLAVKVQNAAKFLWVILQMQAAFFFNTILQLKKKLGNFSERTFSK